MALHQSVVSIDQYNTVKNSFPGTAEVTDVSVNLSLEIASAILDERGAVSDGRVNIEQPSKVRVAWLLSGTGMNLVCGLWCVQVHFESMGSGDEFTLEGDPMIPNEPCQTGAFIIEIPITHLTIAHCGSPYKMTTSIQFITLCNSPAPIVGFKEFKTVNFYKSTDAIPPAVPTRSTLFQAATKVLPHTHEENDR